MTDNNSFANVIYQQKNYRKDTSFFGRRDDGRMTDRCPDWIDGLNREVLENLNCQQFNSYKMIFFQKLTFYKDYSFRAL